MPIGLITNIKYLVLSVVPERFGTVIQKTNHSYKYLNQ